MDKKKKSLLIACVIGDGYIYKDKRSKSCTLEISHSIKQEEYLKYKANLLKKATGKKCEIKYRTNPEKQIRKNYKATKELNVCRIFCNHKYFRVLKKWLYPNGKKNYVQYVKYLDPLGIAIWYMDDGSTYVDKKRDCSIQMEFSTFIPKENAEYLIKYFKDTWDIEFRLHKRSNNQYNIRCYKPNSIKLAKLIEPYVPESMRYKINFLSNI